MVKKFDSVINQVLLKIEPSKEEFDLMKKSILEFKPLFEKNLSGNNILAEVFLGGSFAKNTVIKKGHYDADIFVRFDEKYRGEDISKLTGQVLEDMFPLKLLNQTIKCAEVIHGSRDYFKVPVTDYFCLEIIPVLKVKTPEQSSNITDLSYLHVKYLDKKIKSKEIIDGIKLAKAFCHAKKCYGAESYINGFSGYSLELLTVYYQGFEKLVRAFSKHKTGKIIIDMEKLYKNKNEIMLDINSSKLISPVILVDPTFKQRNALAALNLETFEQFKVACEEFIKNPTVEDFEMERENISEIKKEAKLKKFDFIEARIFTQKQEGDIAGTKLYKFFNHLVSEVSKYYQIEKKGFLYSKKQSAEVYFVLKSKGEILFKGPKKDDEENYLKFKLIHKNSYVQNGQYFAKEKFDLKPSEFLTKWKKKNSEKIKEMQISKIEII